jgi:hypothetical protein
MRRAGTLAVVTIVVALLASTAAMAAGRVVLGGVVFGAPTGVGWGTVKPAKLVSGSDLGSAIDQIHWSSWGGAVAHATGSHYIFRTSGGGYYPRPITARLKATDIGRCEGHRAYLKLYIREPKSPGGPLGAWRSWSAPNTLCEEPSAY